MVTDPATIPSTVDSANGSKRLSWRRMKSGLRMKPLRPLYSKIPRLSCSARSVGETHIKTWRVRSVGETHTKTWRVRYGGRHILKDGGQNLCGKYKTKHG